MTQQFFRIFFISFISLTFSTVSSIYAEETQNPAPVTNQKTVRVGIYQNFPFVFERDSLPTGFHAELLKEIAKQEGWKLNYQFMSSLKSVLDGLEAGSLDLSMGLVKSKERLNFLTFSTEKTAAQKNQVFVQTKRKDIQQIGDLTGKTVGYINRDSIGVNFNDVCNKLGIQPNTRNISSYEQLTGAVLTGVVDAGIFSAFQGKKIAQSCDLRATPITFKKTDVFFAASKNSTSLILTIDNHLRAWKAQNGSPFHTIETKFFTNSLPQKKQWTTHEILTTISLCLLLIFFAILLGNFMAKETTSSSLSKTSIRNLLLFILGVTTAFGILDSFMEWFFFNPDQQLDLLGLIITDVPPEKIYIRGMFFGISCFFGLFMAKYMSKYEKSLNFLMQSVDRFEQLMDNAPDMVYRMSIPSGRYDFVSKASKNICGYSPEQFHKRPRLMEDLIHPDWEDYYAKQWQNLLVGEMPPVYEYQIITQSGETRLLFQRNTLYINASGEPTAIEAIITDITTFKPQSTSTKEAS